MVAGRYRLERVLGAGGMGVVWAAKHTITRRSVALKFLTRESAVARRRFIREARAMALVRHPNVIEIHDFLELENGSPVVVMELLSGESLAERLSREPRMSLREAASIILPVASAVGAAHAAGIIHRDLKPENIFLETGPHGGVKVLDFGIAKLTAADGDLAPSTVLTESGAVLGTPFYIAPERLSMDREIDHRADVWALGLILYQCLSSVLPTRADNVMRVLRIIALDPIRPIQEIVPDLPPDVADMVGRMLSREVDMRPADLRQVAEVLARHAGAEAPSFGPPGQPVVRGNEDTESVELCEQMAPPRRGIVVEPRPAPHNLPLRRLFVGREEALSVLDETYQHKQRASLFALAGTGKTALALEYAHRALEAGAYPGGVWWIFADGHPLDVMVRLAILLRVGAPALLGHVRPEATPEELSESARVALQNLDTPSLVVLDNANELGLEAWLPGGATRVLATVNERSCALGDVIELDPLDSRDARALSEAIAGAPAGDVEAEACDRVVHGALGGLASAVEVAARAVKAWAGGWLAYEAFLAERTAEALDDARDRSPHYPRGVFAALDVSIERCPPGSRERALLDGAAVFAPDGVPIDWVHAVAGSAAESIADKKALATLEGLGLITVDRDAATLSIHRLVQRRVEDKVHPDTAALQNWGVMRCDAAAHVAAWLRVTVGRTRAQMEAVDARRTHIEKLLSCLKSRQGPLQRQLIPMANELARHLRYRGRHDDSRAWSQDALGLLLQWPDPDWAQMAVAVSNLALALRSLGQVEKGAQLLEQALAIVETTHDPDAPLVTRIRSNLARVLPAIGKSERALSLHQSSLDLTEQTHRPDDQTVAKALFNLAELLVYLGEPEQARPLLERALAIAEKSYGPGHPNVAIMLSTLAMALRDLGEAARAPPLFERAVAINEETHGPDHPEVARSLSNLGCVLRDCGQPREARPHLERAFAILDKHYGRRQPRWACSALWTLVGVLRDLNEIDDAQHLFKRCINLRSEDDTTPGGVTLTADAVGASGRLSAERRLAIAEIVYGVDHPETTPCLESLAEALFRKGTDKSCHKARQLRERHLAICEKAYGPNHPNVGTSAFDLALALLCSGDAAGARLLFERGLAIFEKSKSRVPVYWHVHCTLVHLAEVHKYDMQGALTLLERAITVPGYEDSPLANEVRRSLAYVR